MFESKTNVWSNFKRNLFLNFMDLIWITIGNEKKIIPHIIKDMVFLWFNFSLCVFVIVIVTGWHMAIISREFFRNTVLAMKFDSFFSQFYFFVCNCVKSVFFGIFTMIDIFAVLSLLYWLQLNCFDWNGEWRKV